MALVSLNEIYFGYGGGYLLENVSLQIERGERVGLVGRNGSGKSTLMKLISGELSPDDGQVLRGPGVRIGRLIQEVPVGSERSVQEVVASGLSQSTQPASTADAHSIRHDAVQQEPWELEQHVERVISQMSLDPHARFTALSSGMKRRVLLAQALVCRPDLLLLDEPTNHLDIESVEWLEDFLIRYGGTLVFVTHDRVFLRKLSTRIIEVDRGRLLDWPCDYSTFLQRKEAALEVEAQQQALFDKKLAQEEVWVRTGVKARRTRSEARIRELFKMREERQQRKDRVGNVRLLVQDAERSGRLVIEAKQISFAWPTRLASEDDKRETHPPGTPVLRDFSTLILRGDKIGVIGPNGSGKTHALAIAARPTDADQPAPCAWARISRWPTSINSTSNWTKTKSLSENVGDGNEMLLINGQNRHIIGYLRRFSVHARTSTHAGAIPLRRRAEPAAAGAAVRPSRRTCW